MEGKFIFQAKEKINRLPKDSGVYCFKERKFLYIGKAANIRERVKDHFHPVKYREAVSSPHKQGGIFNRVKKIGYIKTNSEIEALILEANLIKKYQPEYNVIWKDDKNYFFVGITNEDFPRIFITHQPISEGRRRKELGIRKRGLPASYFQIPTSKYTGPFVDGKALKQTLKILRKVFPYRSCKNLPKPRTRAKPRTELCSGSGRPCLWYHLGRCLAPCLTKIKLEEKILFEKIKRECQKNAENIFKILQGEKTQVLKDLKKEMENLSKLQDFERAAKIRDQISALEKILAHARLPGLPPAFELPKASRAGRPGEVGQAKIFNWPEVQKILQEILKTKKEISKIEAYDVSNIQGQLATGAMVTFINGLPNKDFYRRFKIEISGKPNDIVMIKEILNRRFKHPEWPYPDLMLIDGGKAQLNAALEVLNQYKSVKSASISVLALAKKENKLSIEGEKPSTRAKPRTRAELGSGLSRTELRSSSGLGAGPVPHRPALSKGCGAGAGNPILLKNLPREIFNLILQLRDEAHRFALTYHKKLRKKHLFE